MNPLECPAMSRRLRQALVLTAAALQIAAPLSAYARVPVLPVQGDLCSAANVPMRVKTAHGAPTPAPHHCAQSLCCIGGATGAGATPCVPARAVPADVAGHVLPAVTASIAPASIIAAAPPRGPPSRA